MSFEYNLTTGPYAAHVYVSQNNEQIFTLQLDYGLNSTFYIDYYYNKKWFQLDNNLTNLPEEVKSLIINAGTYMINDKFMKGYSPISDNALKFLENTIFD